MFPPPPTGPRRPAAERREEVVDLAMQYFADRGLHGASTEVIAREAGISHAYLFRLFPTKRALFAACSERCCGRIVETFRAAAARFDAGDEPGAGSVLEAMGRAYVALLADRLLLRTQMQLWVACSADDELRALGQAQYRTVVEEVERLSGADADTVRAFMAMGMLHNVAAALSLDDLDEPWVRRLLPSLAEKGGRS